MGVQALFALLGFHATGQGTGELLALFVDAFELEPCVARALVVLVHEQVPFDATVAVAIGFHATGVGGTIQ